MKIDVDTESLHYNQTFVNEFISHGVKKAQVSDKVFCIHNQQDSL